MCGVVIHLNSCTSPCPSNVSACDGCAEPREHVCERNEISPPYTNNCGQQIRRSADARPIRGTFVGSCHTELALGEANGSTNDLSLHYASPNGPTYNTRT